MSHRPALLALILLLSSVVLMGCSMVDAFAWLTGGSTVVLDASQITPLPPAQARPVPTTTACVVAEGLPQYVVMSGDTLAGIAARAGTSVVDLARLNCLSDANRIVAGQILLVPRSLAPLATPTQTPPNSATAMPPGPRVVRFTASPQTVEAGGRVTFEWELEDAESALLRLLYPGGVIVEYGEVPVAGAVSVDVPTDATGSFTAQLIPSPLPERGAFGDLTVSIVDGTGQDVVINSFTSGAAAARPGETISLNWSVSGAPAVSLVVVMPDGTIGPSFNDLAAEGAQSFTFPEAISGVYSFQLWPLPGTLARVMREVAVSVSE